MGKTRTRFEPVNLPHLLSLLNSSSNNKTPATSSASSTSSNPVIANHNDRPRSSNHKIMPARHTWLPEERDVLHICFKEYNLDDGRTREAYTIFSELFKWSHNFNQVRDEWRMRSKAGKNLSWGTAHDKTLDKYDVAEQTRRAAMRVKVLRVAGKKELGMKPIAGYEELHAAGLATLAVEDNAVRASASTALTASSASTPSSASTTSSATTASGANAAPNAALATAPDPESAGSRPGAMTSPRAPKDPFKPMSSTSSLIGHLPQDSNVSVSRKPIAEQMRLQSNEAAQDVPPDHIMREAADRAAMPPPPLPVHRDMMDINDAPPAQQAAPHRRTASRQHQDVAVETGRNAELWMVHYMDLHPNPHHSGTGRFADEPRFRYARGFKFNGDEHPAWSHAGQVMRIVADQDIATTVPRRLEDVMVCSRHYCEMCFDTSWDEELEGDSPTGGLPFVHTKDCIEEDDGILVFAPDLGQDYEDEVECRMERKRVRFFHGDESAVVLSAVCVAESCQRCSHRTPLSNAASFEAAKLRHGDLSSQGPSNEGSNDAAVGSTETGGNKSASTDQPPARSTRSGGRRDKGKGRAVEVNDQGKTAKRSAAPKVTNLNVPKPATEMPVERLPMVHFTNLSHRRDVNGSRYQALHPHKFVDDTDTYLRGGQVYSVFFYAWDDLPARFEDVTICYDRACEVCSPGYQDETGASGSGLPFVHLTSDTWSRMSRPPDELYFKLENQLRGVEWDVNEFPKDGVREVICSSEGKKIKVRVEVCDLEGCRRCHPEDIDRRSDEEKAAVETEKGLWNDRQAALYVSLGLAATGPEYLPEDFDNNAQANANQATPQAGPSNAISRNKATIPQPKALRMVHRKQVVFEAHQARLDQSGRTLKVIDDYFVPEGSDVYLSGGPVYRVTFPDGTTRDVKCCLVSTCGPCQHKKMLKVPKEGDRWFGEGFVHRRELVEDGGVGSAKSFDPVAGQTYGIPKKEVLFEMDVALFQGADGVMKKTGCAVCVEGTCEECDQ
ncbi:uncharacterized protein RCC_08822 [Ramularia collo-cygni]|uniref:Uncharacterized protein n=1 Tax=Ramularia collo-cygni TaxID=112498 RepID=A0A2D3VDI3_9PEZI|nr:uncharacterized protein RCC_08822 [Ramularia collo-cygni]CZT23112.1 uncharacterized protein RCC_08822 [Ramularia collo-cygni]